MSIIVQDPALTEAINKLDGHVVELTAALKNFQPTPVDFTPVVNAETATALALGQTVAAINSAVPILGAIQTDLLKITAPAVTGIVVNPGVPTAP